jgi:cytoskeleton protein RodZ
VGNFGERLKKTRENRKITLEEVAKSTKISTRMLHALEEEKFNELPGGVFNKGFVRAYARHLGLDVEKTLADYIGAVGGEPVSRPEDVELRAIAERKEREGTVNRSTGLPWGALAVLLLLVALGLGVWGFYSREQVRGAPVHHSSTSAPLAEAPVVTSVPAASSQPTSPQNAGADATASAQTSNPEQAVAPASAPLSTPAPLTTSYNPSATPAPGSFIVLIIAHEDSWISISVDGQPADIDTLVAPGEKSIQASRRVVLRAANLGGLAIFFNGKKLPPLADDGKAKTLTFGVNGLEAQSAATQP